MYLLQKEVEYDLIDAEGNSPLAICLINGNLDQALMLIRRGVQYGYVVEGGQTFSYMGYALKKLPVAICFLLIDHGYPLQKALE